jgi:hypothetical protein
MRRSRQHRTPGLFSSLIFAGDLGFPEAKMSESMRNNPNRRLSHARALLEILRLIPDHRRAEGTRFDLATVLLYSILGMVAGANSYRQVHEFIRIHRQRLNDVNAGEKMHRRAGVKLHQGRTPEGPRGGLLAFQCDGDGGGRVGFGRGEAIL